MFLLNCFFNSSFDNSVESLSIKDVLANFLVDSVM